MDKLSKAIQVLENQINYSVRNMDEVVVELDFESADVILELLKEQPKWVSVSEGLPEEHYTIFAKLKGTDKWRSAMFEKMSDDVRIVVVFSDGTRRVSHSHTVDGKWECEKSPVKRTVTHWMPNPAMPKAGEQE